MSRRDRARSFDAVRTIFIKETREILRDRRAVFFAFVLPLLLYPLLFFIAAVLPEAHRTDLRERTLQAAVAGPLEVLSEHVTDEDGLELTAGAVDEGALKRGEVDVIVELAPAGPEAAENDDAPENVAITLRYLQSSPASMEGRRRLLEVVERMSDRMISARFAARGVEVDPGRVVDLVETDVASPAEKSADRLGRLLPFLLILLLFTGGAFAAVDLVAGEKERGTLETLCVQAVSATSIVGGKFLVVLLTSIASVLLNLFGLGAALSLGLAPESFGGGPLVMPGAPALMLVLLLLVPFAILSSAILLAVSSFAGTYREAQTYLFPLTLVVLLPTALAASSHVHLTGFVAMLPVANVSVAIREAVVGRLEWPTGALVFVSTAIYAGVALRATARLLTSERVVLGLEAPPLASDASVEGRERRALAFGAVMLLVVYFGASWLQGSGVFSPLVGLALTLWVVVLLPALVYPLLLRLPLRSTLGLCRTSPRNYVLMLVVAPLALGFVASYMSFQQMFLPLPSSLEEQFARFFDPAGIHPALKFLLFALSPGICEELLWRGVFQGELERRGKSVRAVLIVGLFFGVFHLGIHRLVPTALVGVVLAVVRLRSGSVLPCILLHTVYNAGAIFFLPHFLDGAAWAWILESPLAFLGMAGGLFVALRWLHR